MDSKVSIYDIAKYLDISPATVSYVINGKDNKVSAKTKEKVLKAVEELGYVPNFTAKALSTGKSGLIGILLPFSETSIAFFQNPFYVEFIGGLEQGLENYNYDVVIGGLKKDFNVKNWIRSRNLDGLVMIGTYPEDIYPALKELNIPIVLCDDYGPHADGFSNVRSDDQYGVYVATKYLISLGHKKIGFVGDPDWYPIDKFRFAGYVKALTEYGIDYKDEYLYKSDATFDCGYKIGEKVVKDEIVSAVLCSGDMLAIGLMKKANELGVDVPKDLSVIGFDDIQSANFVYPGLTTVHQNISEKGIRSADIITDILVKERPGNLSVTLEPYLVLRNSVCKIK